MDRINRSTKFCLSRRVEEYYFEEEEEEESDEDISTICNIIHQNALNRSRKLEIRNRLQNVIYKQQPFNCTSDGDSVYATSSSSEFSSNLHASSNFQSSNSFNRKRFNLLSNNLN